MTLMELPHLAGAVYVRNEFSRTDRRVAQTMIEEIRLAFMVTTISVDAN